MKATRDEDTVDERRKIKLARNRRAILDIKAVDDAAGRPGLHGDERFAEHLFGELLDLIDRLGESHAALIACRRLLEFSLAAAAGMNLRFDDPDGAGKLFRRFNSLGDGKSRKAIGRRHAVLAIEFLSLIFVDVHRLAPLQECPFLLSSPLLDVAPFLRPNSGP